MFTEKTESLKEKDTIQVQSAQLAAVVVEACRTVSELHILNKAPLEAKIWKLVSGIHDAKAKVARVQFNINMKIMELELKSEPSTLPEVRE